MRTTLIAALLLASPATAETIAIKAARAGADSVKAAYTPLRTHVT